MSKGSKIFFVVLCVSVLSFVLVGCGAAEANVEETAVNYFTRADDVTASADSAWQELVLGNERFLTNDLAVRDWEKIRESHKGGQWPFVSIVSCSDSRFSPEVLFDQAVGDVFIVRTAGNTVDDLALGSLEFSVNVLNTPLIVIMGHEGCGAVFATTDVLEGTLELPEGFTPDTLLSIVAEIAPAVEHALATDKEGIELREYATTVNMKVVAGQVIDGTAGVKEAILSGEVTIVGAKAMHDGTIEKLFDVNADNLETFMSDLPVGSLGCQSEGCSC